MFSRMISHFSAPAKANDKTRNFDALNSRYVDSLTKLYAQVYGR